MKVQELKKLLENFDDESDIGFSYNYGDRHRTSVVGNIRHVNEVLVVLSEYHKMLRVVEDDDEHDPEAKTMVVLQD